MQRNRLEGAGMNFGVGLRRGRRAWGQQEQRHRDRKDFHIHRVDQSG